MNLGLGLQLNRRLTASILTLIAASAIALTASTGAPAASSGGVGVSSPSGNDAPARTSERAGGKYRRIWKGFDRGDRRWARKTSECESGGDPDAIGGGGMYRGAFQFMRSTWKASPKSPGGDPVAHPYRTQAVVAVLLMHRDGPGHWPVCG